MTLPFVNAGDEREIDLRGRRSLDSPFWKVMGFLVVAMFGMFLGVGQYVARTALEKLDRLNDNQIRMAAKMEAFTESSAQTEAWKARISQDVEDLKINQAQQTRQQSDRQLRNYK